MSHINPSESSAGIIPRDFPRKRNQLVFVGESKMGNSVRMGQHDNPDFPAVLKNPRGPQIQTPLALAKFKESRRPQTSRAHLQAAHQFATCPQK